MPQSGPSPQSWFPSFVPPVYFLHRIGGDALDQRIRVFGGRVIGRIDFAALPVQDRDVAPDELTDLTLERVRRRLIDVNQFFRWTPVGRSEFLRAGFLCHRLPLHRRNRCAINLRRRLLLWPYRLAAFSSTYLRVYAAARQAA